MNCETDAHCQVGVIIFLLLCTKQVVNSRFAALSVSSAARLNKLQLTVADSLSHAIVPFVCSSLIRLSLAMVSCAVGHMPLASGDSCS